MSARSLMVVAPLLVPLATALVTLALARRPHAQRVASLAGALALLLIAVVLLCETAGGVVFVTRVGGWDAPFAIEFRVDALSALMIAVAALLAVLAIVYSHGERNTVGALSPPLLHALLAGAGGAYATADLFNLYVWFEVMLIAALGLIVGGRRTRHLDASIKYLVLNVFGTVLLLVAVAGLYGLTGQLNYTALGEALQSRAQDPLALTLTAILLVSMLLKAGAFPFFFWLPAAYPVLPVPLLALFTALMTKVAAYAVLRVSTEIFPAGMQVLAPALGWLAVATMIVGVFGAVYHYDIRRILAFHSVSQMGYVLLAAALGGTAGITAALFFVVHHIVIKSNLYLVGGMIAGSGGFDLRRMGGLYAAKPALALLFGITAAALVGVPPFSGFWAKLLVVREGFAQAEYVWAAAALATGGLTLFSMTKIWNEAFWKPHPEGPTHAPGAYPASAWLATGTLALLALAIGLMPEPLLAFLEHGVAAMHPISSAAGSP